MDGTSRPPAGDSSTNVATIVKAQIVFLLSTLSEEHFERNQLEIRSLSEQHGLDIYLHFIRRLISQSQRMMSTSAIAPIDPSSSLTFRLLVQETQRLARDPFLADRFREAIDKGELDVFRHFDFVRFVERVGLRALERVILAAAILSSHDARRELKSQATTILRVDFDHAINAMCQRPTWSDQSDLTQAQVAKLLTMLLSDPPPDQPVLDASQRASIIFAAQSKFGHEAMAPVLQNIFPALSLPPGSDLVTTLIQLGQDVTSDPQTVRSLLARFGITSGHPPNDMQVVEIVQTLARRVVDTHPLCDVGALIRALSSYDQAVNWANVIRSFDRPDRQGVDTATLKLVIAVLMHSPREAEHPAVHGFWTTWSNAMWQLRLLDALLSLPGDTFNFVSLPGRRVVRIDDVAGASPTIKALAANVQGHTWNSLDLFEILVRLGVAESPDVRACVRDMLDKAVKISAELVHMGLLQVPKPWNDLQKDYASKLLHMFLGGHPNHQLVFMRIWQIDPTYLTTAFRDFYTENPLNITRILDVAQDLKILDALLDVRPFLFSLDVAALASRREYLNLDKWLADQISQHGAAFLRSIIDFLDIKTTTEKQARMTAQESPDQRTMSLSAQTIAIFLRVLRTSSDMLDQSDIDYCLEIRNACLQVYPRLMNFAPGAEQDPGFSVVSYSQDIEAEVDDIYKQLYEERISIDQVVDELRRMRDSTNTRDHEVFSCMLHFLFDEYKFFQSFYPERELRMTAYLFGSLIEAKLIEFISLGIAIRYVIDSLQCPPGSNLFLFGITALRRFEARLREWQPLCQALLSITTFVQAEPELAESCRRALSSESNLDGLPPGVSDLIADANLVVFTAIRSDAVEESFDIPPEEVSDRILFVINNLDSTNFDTKLLEMKDRLDDEFSRWFANYLVDQRVSTEPNNHGLYLRFIDGLDKQQLTKMIINETIFKSATLLNSEKTVNSVPERTVVKNLATWLGELTLARNQPIKHRNIAFKELLLEGYDSGRLALAIPFVCRVLEACAKSQIFQPPNPWLMAVLALLAELYHFADLKLNLRFEIEKLYEKLSIDGDKIEASSLMRNRPVLDAGADNGAYGDVPGYDRPSTDLLQPLATSPVDVQRVSQMHIEHILTNLAGAVVFGPLVAPYQGNPPFKSAVIQAVDRSVREIILPVVERSVTIASISTRELVTKDFAMEGDENRMRNAARMMAQKLAGSLALVTCREPLRSNLAQHLRSYLSESGLNEAIVNEAIVNVLVTDNLEVACEAIERAAMDRAAADVDDSFARAFDDRRRHREQRLGNTYWDTKASFSNVNPNMPDTLRIKPGGLAPQQLHVYEEFGFASAKSRVQRPVTTPSFSRNEHVGLNNFGAETPLPDGLVQQAGPPTMRVLSYEVLERLTRLMADVEVLLQQIPEHQQFALLPQPHPLRSLGRQIENLAAQSSSSDDILMQFSQRVVHALFKTTTQVGRDFYTAMLERLCRHSEHVAKEVLLWLLLADDERKYSVPVIATLLRASLLPLVDWDQELGKTIWREPRPSTIDFAVGLIRHLAPSHAGLQATAKQFPLTVDAIKRVVQIEKGTESARRFYDDVLRIRTRPDQNELTSWFLKWVAIFQRSAATEKAFVTFIQQLQKEGVLNGNEQQAFFRVCTEVSIESYRKQLLAGDTTDIFQPIDALSRLVTLIIKYHGETATQTKTMYCSKILSIVVVVLAHSHETLGSEFQPKPFFRFFSSLLNDLHSMAANLGQSYFQILISLCDQFSTLQPTFFPGFAFSWITLISHRLFMPKLLLSDNREGWAAFHKLIIPLFKFLAAFLRPAHLSGAVRDLYRGAMRLLVVLLHDFPEFLSEYYFTICDVIPPRCIQLRNVVLSAYPASMILPDPHLRNIKLESLPDMGPIPPLLSDFTSALKTGDLRNFLDPILLNRGNMSGLSAVRDRLRAVETPDPRSEQYNLSVVNALVMYVGVSSVAQAKSRSGSSIFVPSDPGVVVLQYLVNNVDAEGQYHLLSAMIMHLRYPNAHTHWFSSLVLYLFVEVDDDRFREILTRALLERFIVHRPHPWGAMVTFIELLRNPKYDFWNHEFVRVAPEIQMLLEGVKREM